MTAAQVRGGWVRGELLSLRAADDERQAELERQRAEERPTTPPVSPSSTSWLAEAACKGRDTNWWFPVEGDRLTAAVAKLVCSTCPVKGPCLDDALAEEAVRGVVPFGIRGGKTADHRARLLRRPRRRLTG